MFFFSEMGRIQVLSVKTPFSISMLNSLTSFHQNTTITTALFSVAVPVQSYIDIYQGSCSSTATKHLICSAGGILNHKLNLIIKFLLF